MRKSLRKRMTNQIRQTLEQRALTVEVGSFPLQYSSFDNDPLDSRAEEVPCVNGEAARAHQCPWFKYTVPTRCMMLWLMRYRVFICLFIYIIPFTSPVRRLVEDGRRRCISDSYCI
jgi:hypothetical protein